MRFLLLAICGQLLDVTTTWAVISIGGIEKNPIYGPDPNLFLVLLVKFTVISFVYLLLRGKAKLRVLGFGALIGICAAGWNLHVFQSAI